MNDVDLSKKVFKLIEAKDLSAASQLLADDFTFSGPVPEPIGAEEYLGMSEKLGLAFPDWSFNLDGIHEHGDAVHASVQITGTHLGELDLSPMGMPSIPATGKSISLPREEVIIKCEDGKICSMRGEPSPDSGVTGILSQLGIELPMM